MRLKNPGMPSGGTTLLVLILGLICGVELDRVGAFGLLTWNKGPNIRLISQASAVIERHYVDRAAERPPRLTYGAISGMVDALGDTGHSRFLSPSMVTALAQMQKNKFQGIGAEVQSKSGQILIAAPLDGSPAQRAGLKPGDRIVQVNGHSVTGQSLDRVVKEIAGPAGTSVSLTVRTAATDQTRQITLTRAMFEIHNVTWNKLPGTNLVQLRIAEFDTGVAPDLRSALLEIKKQPVEGIVLDLRSNPGGLLDEAVDCASEFLKGGNVLLEKNARGAEKPVPVKPGGEATTIPLVVLVNAGTGSGAEIVAGAIRDAHRAPLVGQTTFGTGTLLNEFKLADGSALLLATEEWLTPAGGVIWHKGIAPNVDIGLAPGVAPLFPETEHGMSAQQIEKSGDAQLLRAMSILEGHS